MRRSTVLAVLLVAAASSSQCSDGETTAIGPSAPAGRFANTGGGSSQGGDDTAAPTGGDSGPAGGSSISRLALILVNDRNSDGRPNRGDTISFAIATTQPWDQVSVVCSQNGDVVLSAEKTPETWSPLTLMSQTWTAGPADCKATLDQVNEDDKVLTLASAMFTAGA